MNSILLREARSLTPINLPEPSPPGPCEALVQVHAMGVCGTDISGYLGKMPFIQFPRILGHELGVEVLAIGSEVNHLQVGDRCCVEPYLNCGHCVPCQAGQTNCCENLQVLGVHCDGGLRERLVLPAEKLYPANDLSYAQLALIEMLGIGCHAVNRAQVAAGDEVLVVGAGPIGMTVVEFALLAGANVAVHELNPARRDFLHQHYPSVRTLDSAPEEPCADIVFDATGNPSAMANALQLARFMGRVVYVGITNQPVLLNDALFHRRELTLLASRNSVPSDFQHILRLMRSGQLRATEWITHTASMAEAPEGFRKWTEPGSEVVKALIDVT
jgi:alcohol dehydrogenase